jgi:peptidoglycan/LPS O-acetylase OafA/YrhL
MRNLKQHDFRLNMGFSAGEERPYRNDIDGLRAVAVLSVMLYHLSARWLPGGFVGVDIFFVISGFVVSASLLHAPRDRFLQFVAFFYARRLARIVPALVLVLVVTATVATLLVPRAWLSGFSEKTAIYAFLGLSNWAMENNLDTYFAPRAEYNPYTHTWSLGVEEQFYLVFPFLFFSWVTLRERRSAQRLATAITALLGFASFVACIYATRNAPATAFYSILCRFWELAVGVLLYQLSAQPNSAHVGASTLMASVLPWLGLAAIIVTFAFGNADAFPWFWACPPVLGAALVIGGYQASVSHPLRCILGHPVCGWIGKRSYSLYLWHWPVFVLLRWTIGLENVLTQVIGLAASVALAAFSYRWVELPIRQHAGLLRRVPIHRILLMLAIVVAGWAVTRTLFSQQHTLSLSTVSRNADDWYVTPHMPRGLLSQEQHPRPCVTTMEFRSLAGGQVISYVPVRCDANMVKAAQNLSVVGDSHATAYLPMLDQLSAEMGMRISVFTYPGCSFLDLRLPMHVGRGPGCVEFTQAATRDIRSTAKAGDIVFLASLRQPRFSDQWAAFNEAEVLAAAQGDLAKQWQQQARDEASALLQPFFASSLTVLFDAPKPIFRSPAFRCSDLFNADNPICRGGLAQPRDLLEKLRAPVVANLAGLATAWPQVHIWDPFPVLCPDDNCSAMDAGRPLFFDGDHLSAYGNARLYPAFRDLVRTLIDVNKTFAGTQ